MRGILGKARAESFFQLNRNQEALDAYRKARDLYHAAGSDHGLGNTWQGEAD